MTHIKKSENLVRALLMGFFIGATLFAVACADPAADKPKASVAPATPDGATPSTAGSEEYQLTPENTKIGFVGSKVTGSHQGSFQKFTGTVKIVNDKVEESSVAVDIDMDSVTTDTEDLTKHLKSADFFDVAKFPKTTFSSNKIVSNIQGSSTHTVSGNFELHGEKRQIAFPALITLAPDKIIVKADFSINRKDFGIVYAGKADDLIRDQVLLQLNLEVPRTAKK